MCRWTLGTRSESHWWGRRRCLRVECRRRYRRDRRTDQLEPRLPSGRAKLSVAVLAAAFCGGEAGGIGVVGGSGVLCVESEPQPRARKATKSNSRPPHDKVGNGGGKNSRNRASLRWAKID